MHCILCYLLSLIKENIYGIDGLIASEMHLNSFTPSSRFSKEVSFRALALRELSDEQDRVNIANNVMVANNNGNGNSNVISKSSSSDSDSNSATRLLDHDHDHDFRNCGYLLLSPGGCLNNSASINDHINVHATSITNNSQDLLWSTMQNSLSKEIRKEYLIKKHLPSTFRKKEYKIVGFNVHMPVSSIKCALTLTFILLVCVLVLFLMSMLVTKHINTMSHHASQSPPRPEPWWQGTTFYEIFVASFKDSDADGYGDLQGLREKVTYLKELGIQAVRLNSIFSALDYPHRYESVLDFESIDPHIAKNFQDFVDLVNDLRKANIKLILDINPTVTSEQHIWAAHWLLNKSGEYEHFYVNSSVQKRNESANAQTETSSSETDSLLKDKKETHLSFGGQLALNWTHLPVRKKMLQVFHFWLDYVDGFYLKGLEHIQIDSDVELHDILAQLRDLLNTKLTGETAMTIKDRKILICSSDFVQYRHKLMWNYGNSPLAFSNDAWSSSGSASIGVASEAFNALKHHGYINANTNTSRDIDIFSFFDLIDFQLSYQINKTETIRDQVNAIFLNAPKSFPWIHWNIGDVRTSRVASLIGHEYSLTSIFLLIMLPGTISVFYGDEIGLQNSFDTISHKEYKSGQLCPMQWASNLNANFTLSNTTLPWMPIHPNFTQVNVVKQMATTISTFNQLTSLRVNNFDTQNLGKHGNYLFHYIDDNEVVLERYFDKEEEQSMSLTSAESIRRFRYVLFANFGNRPKVKDFSDKFHFSRIKISSNPKRAKEFLYMRSLRLEPGEAMIVQVE